MTHASTRIVDSHIHYWDPARFHYGWLEEEPPLLRRFVPDDLDTGGYQLDATLFVQGDCDFDQSMAEVHWVQEIAQTSPLIHGIVSWAPLEYGPGAMLDALSEEPLVVGVRRLLHGEPVGFALEADHVAGVRRAGDLGLVVDLCIRSYHLPDVARLASLCPEVTFVLDHVGKPAIADGEWEPWASSLAALAERPNVHCKLSGLVTEADAKTWTEAQVTPYLARALEVFGPQRCLVGGDWPVLTLGSTYARWFDTVVDALAAFTTDEQVGVLHDNAINVYGLAVDHQRTAVS